MFFVDLDIPNILLVVTAVMNAILGVLIYAKHRNLHANQIYTLNIACIVWWTVSMLIYRNIDQSALTFWTQMLYATPTVIASTFLYFSIYFPDEPTLRIKWLLPAIVFCNGLIIYLIFAGEYIIRGAIKISGHENIIFFGPLYIPYAVYISLFFTAGLCILGYKYFTLKDRVQKRQLSYLLVGYLIASSLAMVTNLILPWLGYFEINWLGQVLTTVMVVPVTYAIFKHRLFSSKVIATEILVSSLWIFQLVQTLVAQTSSAQILNGILLFALFIIGLLLMRSVNGEVRVREQLQILAKDLEEANTRLKELDRQKTEFVSIASHQLRSPLTAIKGYASLLLEGSFGKLPKKSLDAISKIFNSSKFMAVSIEDFLNVSRIELGTIKYDFKEMDLPKMIGDIVGELRPAATDRKLELAFVNTCTEPCMIKGDMGKLRQVLLNLVDNAIKYTPKGSITVTVRSDAAAKSVRVEVADTGVGIPPNILPTLFGKFIRAANANEVNVMGTGLGLYVAKQFVEAHGGRVWAESEGQNKGSTFIAEFPLVNKY